MTSHIVFDSSYVSDTWDWFESILIDWTRCYGMIPTLGHSHLRDCFFIEYVVFLLDTSHWGTPSLVRGWFLDDQYTRAYSSQSMMDFFFLSRGYPSEEIKRHFSHWSMRHDWHISFGVLYSGASLSQSMMVLRHSCSLEVIRFLSHWSTRYDWVISLMWSQEHSLLIIVDRFLRWLDQDTDTYESMQ